MHDRRQKPIVVALVTGVVVLLAGGLVIALHESPAESAPTTSAPVPTEEAPSVPAAPAPAAPAGPVVDGTVHDLTGLPPVDVFAIVPELSIEPATDVPPGPEVVTPVSAAVPVFGAPGSAPVAQLLAQQVHDGTTVPVVEQSEHWLRVLLPARAGYPSEGVVGQTTGWVRRADVTTAVAPFLVTVSLAGSITIVENGTVVHASDAFGYGTAQTPTPLGGTFIMTTFTDPAAGYTRGLPIVALGVQSPTLDGFGGTDVAVTAFHYHDVRADAVSNGCLRVDEATILRLAALPLGTPVLITA